MPAELRPFTVQQTHGILRRAEHQIEASSDDLGWASLYASIQHERPYQDQFAALDDFLIIVHRDGPVPVERRLSGANLKKIVQPGGLFILPARRDFGVSLGADLATIHVYVRADFIRAAATEMIVGDPDKIEILARLGERDELIEQAALSAWQMIREGSRSEWCAESLARTIAMQLVRQHSTATLKLAGNSTALSGKRLKAVEDFIAAHLDESITLTDLAGAAALSPIHFARQFKKAAGTSPHQFLLSARVETAKRLLRTDLPIAEIAVRCGFSHQEHLTRMFSRLVGMPPAAYRRTLR